MSHSSSLRLRDFRDIFRLVGECRELGDDRLAWRTHLLAALANLVDADLGCAGEMRGCRSVRVVDLGVARWMRPGLFNPALIDATMDEFRRDPARTPILFEYFRREPLAEGACLARADLQDDRAWYASDDYQVTYRPCGADHLLFCFGPVPHSADDDSAGVILARAKGRPRFSARELLIVQEAHAAIAPLVGGPLARFAHPSPLDLGPRVRQVLACLLEGDSDKQVAARLSMSPYTVNQYTKAIFRHFGCRSRAELLALWIRRHSRGRSHWTGLPAERSSR
jgi:DNA-binding CsgD family transcriptional regulator